MMTETEQRLFDALTELCQAVRDYDRYGHHEDDLAERTRCVDESVNLLATLRHRSAT